MLLLLIPIGSYTAFNAIVSLVEIALYFSYTMPCLFILMRRLQGGEIPHSTYALGKWPGILVNGFATIYGIFVCVWVCFPSYIPVTPDNMNWSCLIFGAVLIIALVDWFVRGKHKFRMVLQPDVIF
jgi:choline transport protein